MTLNWCVDTARYVCTVCVVFMLEHCIVQSVVPWHSWYNRLHNECCLYSCHHHPILSQSDSHRHNCTPSDHYNTEPDHVSLMVLLYTHIICANHLSLHAVTELKLLIELNVLPSGDISWKYLHMYKPGYNWVKRTAYSTHGLMQRMNSLWRYGKNTLTLGELGGSILHCWTAQLDITSSILHMNI